jgi:hypothetical protein
MVRSICHKLPAICDLGRASIIVGGIEVRGTADFLARTREALALLGVARRLEFVQANIAVIQQARRSGMKAWLKRPTFTVGKATWQHSARWYAGAIAHDAYHSKLYREAKNALSGATRIPLASPFGKGRKRGISPAANSWTGAEAEKKCLVFQLQVLRELDAASEILSYVEQCANNPTYQGRNQGWRGWLAYRRRWW